MGNALVFVVFALAVARATRLVTSDKITERPRNAILRRLPDDSLWAYLLLCSWCVSVYLAPVAAILAWLWGDRPWVWVPAAALAMSYVTGWLASHEGE